MSLKAFNLMKIQKRYFSGGGDDHGPPLPPDVKLEDLAPISSDNIGRTGYGEIRGEMRNIMGGPIDELTTFPSDMGKLERGRWFPYSLTKDYPPFITTSPEQNQRIWTEYEMERLLDHHPPHEVHASELPDYHYFPQISAELDPKFKYDSTLPIIRPEFTQDVTDVPRFFRTGIPKTPRHDQDWYIPRLSDGRFNWRENITKNGYTASLFDVTGWNRRFLVSLNRPNLPMHTVGLRQFAQMPIFFRSAEQNLAKRLSRSFYASQFDKHVIFVALYFGSLIYISSTGGHWAELVWNNDPYNYDICFCSENRGKGGFHGII